MRKSEEVQRETGENEKGGKLGGETLRWRENQKVREKEREREREKREID